MNREYADEVNSAIEELKRDGRYSNLKKYIQHGNVTVFKHCRNVAYLSCIIADKLNVRVNRKALIKGALLHDYFLYDWHEKNSNHTLHGFYHPRRALINAMQDYNISDKEANIILRHMFPLTIVPPNHREAWIVCMADKICATGETFENIKLISRVKFLFS